MGSLGLAAWLVTEEGAEGVTLVGAALGTSAVIRVGAATTLDGIVCGLGAVRTPTGWALASSEDAARRTIFLLIGALSPFTSGESKRSSNEKGLVRSPGSAARAFTATFLTGTRRLHTAGAG